MRSCRFVFDELVELYERDGQLAKRSTNRAVFVNLHLLVNPLLLRNNALLQGLL